MCDGADDATQSCTMCKAYIEWFQKTSVKLNKDYETCGVKDEIAKEQKDKLCPEMITQLARIDWMCQNRAMTLADLLPSVSVASDYQELCVTTRMLLNSEIWPAMTIFKH